MSLFAHFSALTTHHSPLAIHCSRIFLILKVLKVFNVLDFVFV